MQSTSESITLRDVFDAAVALNPELLAARVQLDSLVAHRKAAEQITAEPFALEGSYRSDSFHKNQGLREISVGFSAPLWHWNERSITQNLRDAEIEQAQARFQHLRLELAGQIRQQVWSVSLAQLDLELAKARVLSAKALVMSVGRRVDAGELAQTDLVQTRSLLLQTEAEQVRAESALEQVLNDYSHLTNLLSGPSARFVPEDLLQTLPVDRPEHPALWFARAQWMVSQLQAKLAATQTRGHAEVGVSLVADRAAYFSGQEQSLVLSTRIPLGNSADHQARILGAQAEELARKARMDSVQRSIASQVRLSENNLALFEKLVRTADEQAALAQKTYEQHRKAFELGEADLQSVLRFEQAATEARRLARKSMIEHASRVSSYRQALGLLP